MKPDVRFSLPSLFVHALKTDVVKKTTNVSGTKTEAHFPGTNNLNTVDVHVSEDVDQSCMLHAAVRVEWVGNLHPNVCLTRPVSLRLSRP